MRLHTPKPHVSAALAQLQRGVTLSAMLICACAIAQLLVFGFVHFTQVRYIPGQHANVQPLSVVGAAPAPAVAGPRRDFGSLANSGTEATSEPVPATSAPRPLSAWDPALHVASDAAVTLGVIATFALMALTLLGVAVAAGNSTPGVERVVSSCGWSMGLGLMCVPWSDIFTSLPFPGVFMGYTSLTWLSHSVDAGTSSALEMFSLYLVAPLAVVGASLLILFRFRAGVADGFIVTSVSEVDERIEREMANIRNRGVQPAGVPRAVAALNRAIGDRPESPAAVAVSEPRTPAPAHQPRVGRSWGPLPERAASGQPERDDDDGGRRPI